MIKNNLKRCRRYRELKLQDIAKELNISLSAVARLENRNLNDSNLFLYVQILLKQGYSLNDIFSVDNA